MSWISLVLGLLAIPVGFLLLPVFEGWDKLGWLVSVGLFMMLMAGLSLASGIPIAKTHRKTLYWIIPLWFAAAIFAVAMLFEPGSNPFNVLGILIIISLLFMPKALSQKK